MGISDELAWADSANKKYFQDTGGYTGDAAAFYKAGVAEGRMARIRSDAILHEDQRQQGLFEMQKEAFGWKREDRERDQEILHGIAAAGQDGGYNGVIAYLKGVDPKQALKFEKEKVALDLDIMQNDTYKLAHENDKAKVMVEGYQILGKMYGAVQQAPAEEQNTVYQSMLPIIKQVNPNAPEQYDADAKAMGMLSIAQATPQNQYFADKQTVIKAQSEMGKLQADIDARRMMVISNGGDPDKDKGLNNLLAIQSGKLSQAEQAQNSVEAYKFSKQAQEMQQMKDELQIKNAQQNLGDSISKSYEAKSKPYTTYLETTNKINSALDIVSNTPQGQTVNPAALVSLQSAFTKYNAGVGPMSDQDLQRFGNTATGLAVVKKKMNSWANGVVEPLNTQEVQYIKDYMGAADKIMKEKQSKINGFYQDQLDGYGLPRNQIKMYDSAPQQHIKWLQANPTKENVESFRKQYGYVPDLD